MTDAREIIALQEFAKWAIKEGAFLATDLDGLSIQEKAHELGLIEATAYDPEKHGPSDCAKPGDEWFIFSPLLSALQPDESTDLTVAHAVGKNAYAPFGWTTDAFGKPMPKRSPWDGGDVPLSRSTERTVAHAVGEDGQESQQQEPVAWHFEHQDGDGNWEPMLTFSKPARSSPVRWVEPLYTRPAEQAVTEAMVEAAVQAVRQYTRDTLFIDEHRELVRTALKAAMEAGRHD